MGVEGEYYEGHCKLLELPHYVLSTLFSYVDATSLFHLSQTCNYLKEFIDDPSFWRYIDARDDPNTCSKLHYCTNRTHERTTHLLLHGNLNLLDLPSFFFDKIKPFQNLRVLALENLKLQGSKVALKDFPAGLEELSLRRTYVKNSTYFFQHSVRNLSKLRVLILDECCWVTCSFLLSVSKYEHLEIISIVKCLRVHLNMIPYLNVAKFGCKKLKVFDCRFTGIGGELLRTFYSKESLQRLYFQSFKSAEVDYDEKIIDNSGTGSRKNSNSDPNTAISIADIHLYEYNSTTAKASSEVEKVFDSLLYEDPYPECTCGSVESNEDKLYADLEFFDDDMVHIPSGRGEPKFVCNKHMKDIVNLPSSFRDFFLSQQRQFNPASEAHFDTDSNSDDDEDGCCCYFGMGSSMIIPITHDRTPSRGEEMTLPREGARNQTSRVFILNPMESRNDDGTTNSSNNTFQNSRISPSKSTKRNSSNAIKRRRAHSQSDSDSDPEHSKKSKKEESSDLDGLSNEAQALLVNQLVESADEVKNRIERLMGENGMGSGIQRRISSDNNAVNVNIYPQETKSLDVRASCSQVFCDNQLQQNTVEDHNGRNTMVIDNSSHRLSTNSAQTTRTESLTNLNSNPCPRDSSALDPSEISNHCCGSTSTEILNNSTQTFDCRASVSKLTTNSRQTSADCSSTIKFLCSRISTNSNDCSSPSSGTRNNSNQTRTECKKEHNIDTPSCSQENISPENNISHLSEDDQDFDSSESDCPSDSTNGRLKNQEKKQPDQVKRYEQPELPRRIEPQHRNYLIIENQDRWRQKRKIPLRRLSLRGYRRVTDVTLNYIANLEIELIDLTYTSVTKQGIENFLVHNPNCRVIHPLYCTCKPKNRFLI